MDMPKEYRTVDEPMLTNADWCRILDRSRSTVRKLVKQGVLTPQRLTLGGRPLYEPEYVEWAKVSVPEIVQRMSDPYVE